MSKKIIRPHIAALLLSALLSLAACNSPSEALQESAPSTSDSVINSTDENDKNKENSETKSPENNPENTPENTSDKIDKTPDSKGKTLPKTKNVDKAETVQTAQTTEPAQTSSENSSSLKTEQSGEPKETISSFKPTETTVISTDNQPEQSVSTISTCAPITAAETVNIASIPVTEIEQPTEPQPITTEPPITEPAPEITAEPVFETASQTLAAPDSAAEISPALTGGKYQQRFCTQKEQEFADRVFELTNAERLKEGLAPFEKMETLKNIALTRAWELTVEYRGDHTRPDATGFTGAFNENGIIYGAWGENIAAGQDSPESVVEAWMNSPSHRAAILDRNYTYMGVGYYYIKDDYQCYYHFWTQEFYCY